MRVARRVCETCPMGAGDCDCFYAACLLDPDGNNVEALYSDVGNRGHAG